MPKAGFYDIQNTQSCHIPTFHFPFTIFSPTWKIQIQQTMNKKTQRGASTNILDHILMPKIQPRKQRFDLVGTKFVSSCPLQHLTALEKTVKKPKPTAYIMCYNLIH